jgi:hypothetical protein
MYWKCFGVLYFKKIGGFEILGSNFDSSVIKKLKIPKFYSDILTTWAEVSETEIQNRSDILKQPIWLNRFIKLEIDFLTIRNSIEKGIKYMYQVWHSGKTWDNFKQAGWEDKDFLTVKTITNAIPADWRNILNEKTQCNTENNSSDGRTLKIKDTPTPLNKITSKMLYWEFIEKKFVKPTSQKYLSTKLENTNIDWKLVYNRIYETTIDTKLRMFQYKLLNNCLYLNQKLHLFKLVESANCSMCSYNIETIEHFFVDCLETRNLYSRCRDWLKQGEIDLPVLSLKNVLLGINSGSMENLLFLLFKYLLYNSRNQLKIPTLTEFQILVKTNEKIEYIIAENRSKLATHLKKYEKINVLMKKTGVFQCS